MRHQKPFIATCQPCSISYAKSHLLHCSPFSKPRQELGFELAAYLLTKRHLL